MFRIKRVYLPPAPDDGLRVLVDRLWPRGLSKESAAIDLWLGAIAPSPPLRHWFGHNAGRWRDFAIRYRDELAAPERVAAIQRLRTGGRQSGVVTLLFAAREETHNHAAFLSKLLNNDCRCGKDQKET